MRRILATSIAAAIPIVLPTYAVDAYAKPAPPPVAGGHYRPVPAHARGHVTHAKHATHGRRTSAPTGETQGRPQNDVKVDMGPDAEQGRAPEANAAPDRGAVGAPRSGVGARGVKNRPARPDRTRPVSRPGTGADAGFADADDMVLPAEAAEALKEAAELQGSAQAPRPRAAAPDTNAPGTNAPGTTAPGTNAPQGAVPAAPAPRGTGRSVGRPAQEPQDLSTNQTSTRRVGRSRAARTMPTAFFNANPAPQASRLVLHTTAGTTPERTVTLQCDPAGGTHPKAAEACADVAKAGGDLAQMPANTNPRACFMIYAPVTVTAKGKWQGQPVRFTEKFPNSCVMRDKTGSVFDF
jgi:Subtilisin inhibitor-like